MSDKNDKLEEKEVICKADKIELKKSTTQKKIFQY